MKSSLIQEKSYAFALRIIPFCHLLREKREYELASQLIRCGTSIGSNVEEALAGVSRADFIAKMAIASKEARETNFRLRLLRDTKIVPLKEIETLINESLELVRILTSIVKTSQTSPAKTKN
ncbi:MAG: four helix bundle protein [Verrucomicrobiota bacterium]